MSQPIEEFTLQELEDELVTRSASIVIVREPRHDEVGAQIRLTHDGKVHEVLGLLAFARHQCLGNIIDLEDPDLDTEPD